MKNLSSTARQRENLISSHRLAEGHDESEEALDIRLGVRVTKVAVSEDDNCVTVTTDNGETITSSAVVVTVPLGILKTEVIEFEPSLPRPKLEAVRNCGETSSSGAAFSCKTKKTKSFVQC